MIRSVYQTLKFKGNDEEVQRHGPYKCSDSKAWLHQGYYFWEQFIEPAHYWGKTWNKGRYIIARGQCLITDSELFDLVGNTDHIKQIREVFEYLADQGLVNENTTVSHVIDFLIKTNTFDFIAARAITTESFAGYKYLKLNYEAGKKTSLIMNPAIQICIYDLEKAYFEGFEIVYTPT